MSGHDKCVCVCVCACVPYVPYHMCVLCLFEGKEYLMCACVVCFMNVAVYECECEYVCCVGGRGVSCVWCDV